MRISRFTHGPHRTAAYESAVSALRTIAEDDYGDTALRACGEVVAPRRVDARQRGPDGKTLRQSRGHPCIQRLLGRRCFDGGNRRYPCSPPASDHPTLWLHEGKPYVFISEPYRLTLSDVRDIIAFADDNDLEVTIDAGLSCHFPGRTVAVIYRRKEQR